MASEEPRGFPNSLLSPSPISSLSFFPTHSSHIGSLLFLEQTKIFPLPETTFFQISTWLPPSLPPFLPVWFTHTYIPFPLPVFILLHLPSDSLCIQSLPCLLCLSWLEYKLLEAKDLW